MTLRRVHGVLLVSLTALALVGCDAEQNSVSATASSGSTGDGGTDSGAESDSGDAVHGACAQGPALGLDESSSLGLTPQAVIDDAVGVYSGSLHWKRDSSLGYTGTDESTAITIEVRYEGGTALDTQVDSGCGRPTCSCVDALTVEVVLAIETKDGSFDEEYGGHIVVKRNELQPEVVVSSVEVHFDPDETAGTFSSAMFEVGAEEPDHLGFVLWTGGDALEGGLFGIAAGGNYPIDGIGDVGAVRDPRGCYRLFAGGPASSCAIAGCFEVPAVPVLEESANACSCDTEWAICHPTGVLEGGEALFTHTEAPRFGSEDQVFLLQGDPGGDWRSCDDAPEVGACSCDLELSACE